jgi:hypothetical protein
VSHITTGTTRQYPYGITSNQGSTHLPFTWSFGGEWLCHSGSRLLLVQLDVLCGAMSFFSQAARRCADLVSSPFSSFGKSTASHTLQVACVDLE